MTVLEHGERVAALEKDLRELKHKLELDAVKQSQTEAERLRALAVMQRDLDELKQGFPDEDIKGHCDYHRDKMDEAAVRRKRRDEIITEVGKKGAWAALALIAFSVWEYIKAGAKQ